MLTVILIRIIPCNEYPSAASLLNFYFNPLTDFQQRVRLLYMKQRSASINIKYELVLSYFFSIRHFASIITNIATDDTVIVQMMGKLLMINTMNFSY